MTHPRRLVSDPGTFHEAVVQIFHLGSDVIPVKRAAACRAPAAPIDNRNRNSFSRPLELPLEKVPSCAQ
jgi:hypothetical protein